MIFLNINYTTQRDRLVGGLNWKRDELATSTLVPTLEGEEYLDKSAIGYAMLLEALIWLPLSPSLVFGVKARRLVLCYMTIQSFVKNKEIKLTLDGRCVKFGGCYMDPRRVDSMIRGILSPTLNDIAR